MAQGEPSSCEGGAGAMPLMLTITKPVAMGGKGI
jgi:hypothetical protein